MSDKEDELIATVNKIMVAMEYKRRVYEKWRI